ncbi:MAG: hypothetical protein IPP74_00560 [Alphaproteobacteria bacterium]|nr:hypothetical protein [Alphaproteobacteria bacterium]
MKHYDRLIGFYGFVLLAFLATHAQAEHGFIPDTPGNQEYTDEAPVQNSTRYYFQKRGLEVEIVEDTDGTQYAYTVSAYESRLLDDGLYRISREIISTYIPGKERLHQGDYVMVILGGKVANYYTADDVIY